MISVIIPVLNEAGTIQDVIAIARHCPLVTEVLVIDDGSIDGTSELSRKAGATVISSTLLGKGASMEDGVRAASNDCVVFLDGDLTGLAEDIISRLSSPILEGRADFVKGRFTREAGRVTELVARPLLRIFLPKVASFTQPLGGLIAARRSLLSGFEFETDYGVDIGLLIDAVMGGHRVVEVYVGHVEHDSQTLMALAHMAAHVSRTILRRASHYGTLRMEALAEVEEVEHFLRVEIDSVINKAQGGERLALIDMDGVLLQERFLDTLAAATTTAPDLVRIPPDVERDPFERAQRIAALWKGVDKATFVRLARETPLMDGAVETVIALRRAGYRVVIVSDSYVLVAEIIRRRVFADAAIAYLVHFSEEKCTGELVVPEIMCDPSGRISNTEYRRCVAQRLMAGMHIGSERVMAIGSGIEDVPMFQEAGCSIAYRPSDLKVGQATHVCVEGSLTEVLANIEGRV